MSHKKELHFINDLQKMKQNQRFVYEYYDFYYFCNSRNIIETSRFPLIFSKIFVILRNSDILFDSEYKREI